MDPNALAGMIFTLLIVLLIGGFIVLFPITRRLGLALEVWITEHRKGSLPPDTSAILSRLDDLTVRLAEVEDQNAFIGRLVSDSAELRETAAKRRIGARSADETVE